MLLYLQKKERLEIEKSEFFFILCHIELILHLMDCEITCMNDKIKFKNEMENCLNE